MVFVDNERVYGSRWDDVVTRSFVDNLELYSMMLESINTAFPNDDWVRKIEINFYFYFIFLVLNFKFINFKFL
jgi:hypothetical protein